MTACLDSKHRCTQCERQHHGQLPPLFSEHDQSRAVAVRIEPDVDTREAEILRNPSGYFDAARRDVRAEIQREKARGRGNRDEED
jgi:hypothetical protein